MAKKEKNRTFGSVVLGAFLRLKGKLPLSYHYFWADFFGWILRTVRYRYDVVMINLARSFPEKKYKELKKIASEVYRHFGELIAEGIWYSACKGDKGRRRLHRQNIISLANTREFNEFFAGCPKGVMVLNSHSGNWELIGGILNYNYDETCALDLGPEQIAFVYKHLHSRTWDILIRHNRLGVLADLDFDGYQESGEILRYAVEHKNDKKFYLFITDQHPYKGAKGVGIGEFMHQDTKSMTGAGALAAKFGMGVVYLRWNRTRRGHYDLTLVPMFQDATGMDPAEIMKSFYKLLEEDLCKQPFNYLWTHKRWK